MGDVYDLSPDSWHRHAGLIKRIVELNTTTASAVLVRTIHTPWPLEVVLMVISFAFAFVSVFRTRLEHDKLLQPRYHPDSAMPMRSPRTTTLGIAIASYEDADLDPVRAHGLPITKLSGAVWVINFLRAIAALIYVIVDLAQHSNGADLPVPSIGVCIIFGTLLADSLHNYKGPLVRLAGRISFALALAGLTLYFANGALALTRESRRTKSVEIVVQTGCAGKLFQDEILVGPWLCGQLLANQVLYQRTPGDIAFEAAWIVGAFLFCFLLLFPTALSVLCSGCDCFSPGQRMAVQDRTRGVVGVVILFGGVAAVVATVLSAENYTASFIDCAGATGGDGHWKGCVSANVLLSGSSNGFWSLWTAKSPQVARSVFVWN